MGPKIIENSHCQLLIQYQTELACQQQIDCKAKVYVEHSEDVSDMEIIDLTPLINTIDNYEAEIDSAIVNTHHVTKATKVRKKNWVINGIKIRKFKMFLVLVQF